MLSCEMGTLREEGGGSGEYNGASSSYNGVAAIYFLNCDRVSVVGTRAYNHAGGSFAVFAGRVRHFENVTCEGIGYPFIDPIGQGNQGNGSDFAIMCQPTVNNSTQLFLFEDTFINCRLFDHAFGIQTVATKSLQMVGNEIGPCPGQHGVYGIENDGINIVGNIFRECRQMGFKMQFENYAGLYMGPAWAPSTSYAVGDVVTAFGVLWVCKTAHTSGGTFNSANWNIDPLWYREGGVIADNIFDLCGVGIGFISTTATNGRNMASIGQIISGNVIRDSNTTSGGMYLNRLNDALIEGNMIEGGSGPGIYGTDFSGSIKDNIIKSAAENGISISLSWQSWFEGNTIYDCGLSGTNDGNRAPILIFPVTADGQPDAAAAGKVVHIDCSNKIFYTTGDCPGAYLLYSTDSRINANIYETKGGATTKTISFAGTILAQWRNFWRKEGEGVFTPTVIGATSPGTGTYTTQSGIFSRLGNLVVFEISLSWTAHSGTGNMLIGGLPFPATTRSAVTPYGNNISLAASTILAAFVDAGATRVSLVNLPVGGGVAVSTQMDSSASITISGQYFTS